MNLIRSITLQQWMLFALGASVPYIIKLAHVLLVRVRRRRVFTPYLQTWTIYHWSRQGYTPVFREETWTIKRGFLTPLVVTTSDKTRSNLQYKGKVRFEAGYVIVEMTAINHQDESWQAVIQSAPIPTVDGEEYIIRGLLLDQDFDRKLYSTAFIGLTNPTEVQNAKAALETIANFNEADSSLRLAEVPVSTPPRQKKIAQRVSTMTVLVDRLRYLVTRSDDHCRACGNPSNKYANLVDSKILTGRN